jgi:hypothetical protein
MEFDKIVEDIGNAWEEAIPNGILNKNNPYHVVILEGVLDKFNLTREQKLRMLNSVRGIKEDDIVKNKKSGNTYVVKTHNKKTQNLVKGDASPEDIEKVEKDDSNQGEEKSVKANAEVNKEIQDKISKEKNPKKKEALKAEYISNQLDNMLRVSDIESGAGRYDMSREDVEAYRKYLTKIMSDSDNEPGKTINTIRKEQQRKYGEINEGDIDSFIADLEVSSKSGSEKSDMYDPSIVKNIKTKIKTKGGPGSTYTTGNLGAIRYRNVIKAYLETGGISPITGKQVPFSECQLDHIISLGNEGKDEPGNWMFMEERFNQYKGKKTDEDIRANLERDFYLTDAEIAAGEESTEVKNALKAEDRAFWKSKFEKSKGSDNPREIGVTINQLKKMGKTELGNFIYGWNLANPDNELSRYETQKIEVGGKRLDYARGEGDDNPVKPVKGDPSTYGLVVKDGKVVKKYPNDTEEESQKRFNDNRASGGREKSKEQFIEMIEEEGLASDSTVLDEVFELKIIEHRTGQLKRDKAIKAKVKAAKEAPGSMERKKKIVQKSLKGWIQQNPEPGGKIDKNYIKDAKKRKKSQEWQEWKKNKDTEEYKQWSQFASTSKVRT